LAADRAAAADAITAAMNGRRYRALLLRLDRWRTSPPWTEAATQQASAASGYVEQAGKKARRRLAKAIKSGVDSDFHSARKAAKRHRYAAELIEPRAGKSAHHTVDRAKRLQDALGELQDSVTSAATLLDLAQRTGGEAGANAFAYGLLYEQEQRSADSVRRRIRKRHG
jgi:CHAD domain-containing protein